MSSKFSKRSKAMALFVSMGLVGTLAACGGAPEDTAEPDAAPETQEAPVDGEAPAEEAPETEGGEEGS